MPFLLQRATHLSTDRGFECETLTFDVAKARLLARLLHIHAEINQVEQDLHMPLRLHIAAHHSEREPRLTIAENHRGHERVEWALAAFQAIRTLWIERKARAAIVQHNPGIARHKSGAEAFKDA